MIELLLIVCGAIFWPEISKFIIGDKPVIKEPDPEITDPCEVIIYKPNSIISNSGDATLPKGYCYRGDIGYFDDKPHTTGDVYAQKQADKFITTQKFEAKVAEMKNIVLILANDTPAEIDTIVVDEVDEVVVFPPPTPPDAPVADAATNVDDGTFTANWQASTGATEYFIDVATDVDFISIVTGYDNLNCGAVLSVIISGLTNNTFFYRVRAKRSGLTSASSNTITLSTVLFDIDGNIYSQVTIGNQIWLVENLKTTKYANGSSIPLITINATWAADTTGAMCYHDNDIANKSVYGNLYNWYAVNNANGLSYLERNGAEELGWRVPTDVDFDDLSTELGGSAVAGGKMKEAGTTHWNAPNTGADNSSGFTALGSGNRNSDGTFGTIKAGFLIWSADQVDATKANWGLIANNSIPFDMHPLGYSKNGGFSIRLVKDI